IYRLVHEDAKPSKGYNLDRSKPNTLISALKSDNMFWRTTAQRLLVELGDKSVANDLYALVKDRSVDQVGVNGGAIHALWTMHGLGLLDGSNQEAVDVALGALNHPASGVRRAAVQVLPSDNENVVNGLLSSNALQDEDFRVRLATLLKLADAQPSPAIGKAIYEAVQVEENIQDKWLSHGLLIAGMLNKASFTEEFSKNNAALDLSNVNGSLLERIIAGDNMAVFPLERRGGMWSPRQVPDYAEQELSVITDVKMPRNPAKRQGVLITQGD